MEIKNATKAVALVMIATLISKCLGFFREILLGSKLGATYVTDAYLVSTMIPMILFVSIAGAIATTFIPVFTSTKQEGGEEKALQFTSNMLNIVIVASIVLSIIGILFSRQIISLIAIGFEGEVLELAVYMSRILFITIIFTGITNIFVAFLQSNNHFVAPALIGVPYNIIIIGSLILMNYLGVDGLIYATLIGVASQVILLYPFAKRKGFSYNLKLDWQDPYVKKALILAVPVLMGVAVQQINAFIDRMLASGLIEGSISALNFANKLNGFVFSIFSISISTIIYPVLSTHSAENNKQAYQDLLVKSMNVVTILLVPISVGAIILRVPIVQLLFERGAFDEQATQMTAAALLFYAIGIIFYGYRDILNRAFYAFQDTRTPMINSTITVVLNIILNIILVRFLQHGGLALATSISAAVTTVLLIYSLKKRQGHIGGSKIVKTGIKCSIAAVLMGIVVYGIHRYIGTIFMDVRGLVRAVYLLSNIAIGGVLYFAVLYLFKLEELTWLLELIKERFRRD